MRSAIERAGRRTIALVLALVAGVAFAQRPESVKDPLAGLRAYVPTARVSGVIHVSGSPQMGDLLHLYEEGFRSFQPGVHFEESLKSTVTAVGEVASGRAEIGLVGREVWPEEVRAFTKAKGHPPLAIEAATGSYDVPKATFALMIFVNASNPIAALSTEELRHIFAAPTGGEPVRTWGDLGVGGEWASHPVDLYGFSTGNDKSLIFSRIVFKPGDTWNSHLHPFSNNAAGDAGEAIVRAVAGDRDGIGISNVHYATPDVRAVPLSSGDRPAVKPTRASVQSRQYPLVRSVYIVIDPGARGANSEAAREFLRFVLSRDGQQEVVREGNYLPLTPEVIRKQERPLGPG